MAVVDPEPLPAVDRLHQFVILQKFRAIVRGDGLERLPELPLPHFALQHVKDLAHCLRPFVRELEEKRLSRAPLNHGQQYGPAPVLPDDQVNFPMPFFLPLIDLLRPGGDRRQFRVGYSLDRLVSPFLFLPLFPQVLVGQMEEDPLLYVAVQGADADGGMEFFSLGQRQRRRWGTPLAFVNCSVLLDPKHFLFQEICTLPVVPDLQRFPLGGLVAVVDLLSLFCRIPLFVPVGAGVDVCAPFDLVIDCLTAEAQPLCNLCHGDLFPQKRLQLTALLPRHVVLFFRHSPPNPPLVQSF